MAREHAEGRDPLLMEEKVSEFHTKCPTPEVRNVTVAWWTECLIDRGNP